MTKKQVLEAYKEEAKRLLQENEYIEVVRGDFLMIWIDRVEKYKPISYDGGIMRFRRILNELTEEGFCSKVKASHGNYRYSIKE